MFCFGSPTFFSATADACKECGLLADCALACDAVLKRINKNDDLSSQIKKHQTVLKKLGLVEAKKRTKKSKEPEPKPVENIEQQIYDELFAMGVITEDKINWKIAPQWLSIVSGSIEMYGEISSTELIKSVKLKMPEGLAVAYCSKAVIILNKLGYVSVETKRSKQIIKWLL